MGKRIIAVALALGLFCGVELHAGTVNVINTNDALAGSLRQAIQDADAGDTIKFTIPTTDAAYDPATGITTINLTTGELSIGRDLTIDGSGAKIVIQRSSAAGTPDLRIFNVTAGMVTISTVSIYQGLPADGGGGGILNAGNLTVSRCTFSKDGVGSQYGGGINSSGTLTVSDCTLTGNDGDRGATIYSTGTVTLVNSTITGNLSGISRAASGVRNSSGVAHVHSSVIAGNNVGGPEADVFGAFISDGYNFIGATDGSTGFGEPGSHDQIGTSAAPADPSLGVLRDNGGPTFTQMPYFGSPLIDQGSAGGEVLDQIGLPRVLDDPAIANAVGGDGSDIGAVERDLRQIGSPFWLVNSTDERSDGLCGENDCTLIEALDIANIAGTIDSILFKTGLSGTITTNKLTPGGLTISTPVTISGPGARNLTISGNHAARVFQGQGGDAVISGLTITGGVAPSVGGAIYLNGPSLYLVNCTVSGSNATGITGKGGGLYVEAGSKLTLANSTVSENLADTGGGGIYNNGGMLIATDSTISDNQTVGGVGGGIYNFGGTASLTNCTVSRNSGNGLRSDGGSFTLDNTLVAGNTITGSNLPDVINVFVSLGYNLIGISDGSNGFSNGANHDLVGSPAAPLDPALDPTGLQNNGGPTDTIALLAGSAAVDGGDPANPVERDQRSFDRAGVPDIGAYEFGGTLPMTLANISTRARVETGDNVMIGGFIVTGTHAKEVLLRAIGPSLPLSGTLANPILELHDGTGALVSTNDDWQTNTNKQAIIDTAFAPTNALESALLMTLDPGAYTAIVRGVNNGSGIALVEAYDLDRTVDARLANISTRGLVQTEDDVMIGGFIVLGSEDQKVIVRAIGPSLPLTGVLADPTLELHNGDGSILSANDNWRSDQEDEITATGLAPTDDAEAAIVATLTPGPYTAIVRGTGGTKGVGLVEVYGLP